VKPAAVSEAVGRVTLPDMPFSSALVLFAHPDDAEFMCGGTVAAWARADCEVHYVVITDGSAGSNHVEATRESLREIREQEQRAAAEVLGVRSVTFLGELDGMLEVTLDTRRKVTREVRRLRPDVIVAPDPSRLWSGNGYINHSDHKAAGLLALSAIMPDAPTRLMFPELLEEGLEPFEVPNLWLSSNEPDHHVDISETIDLKVKALAQHVSQGGADAGDRVRERALEIGAELGHRYAEAFKTFRFVDDEDEG
jgi:LmbE family N-acetylglucosaminyl deacetylase